MNGDAFGLFAILGGTLATALGGNDQMLKVLLAFMATDYISGLICAGVFKASPKSETGGLESRASLKGLFRKGGILLMVYVAVKIDTVTNQNFIRNMVVLGFIASEGISVIENLGLMGVPIPSAVKNALDALKSKSEAGDHSAIN